MNTQLIELNEIIKVCEDLVARIKRNGDVGTGDDLYEQYKFAINKFYNKYNLKSSDSSHISSAVRIINEFHWDSNYTVNLLEAKIILESVSWLKELLFPGLFENIFISHREKDKEQVEALIELLYAIGIPRPLQNGQSMIFCSSHPSAYIENGEMIDDTIMQCFHSRENTYFILWYTDNYFDSQACLNEMGAIWTMQKQYQEILVPGFDRNKIGGLLPKQKISFYADDKYRLNTLKEQIEKIFYLDPIDLNSWEVARDKFIKALQELSKTN